MQFEGMDEHCSNKKRGTGGVKTGRRLETNPTVYVIQVRIYSDANPVVLIAVVLFG
jgi:hypothetical protein